VTALDVFEGRSQRFESCRFDLYHVNGRRLGELMIDRDQPPRITNDTSRTLRRTLDDLRILSRPLVDQDEQHIYADEYTSIVSRVHAFWLIDIGGTLSEYPLGVFLFANDSTTRTTAEDIRTSQLVDQCALLDQPLDQSLGFSAGQSITAALHVLADLAGVPLERRKIEASSAKFGAQVAWTPGRDTFLTAMESCCLAAGFLPAYFDNSGFLVCRSAPDIEHDAVDYHYGLNTVVIDGSITMTQDQLVAPNRYVVIGGNTEAPIIGIYDVPDSAPHSFVNTGVRRRRTTDVQGIGDTATATSAAYTSYVADRASYVWLSFDTPVDPRHDTWDVIDFDGDRLVQTAWSLVCRHGSTMQHTCRGL